MIINAINNSLSEGTFVSLCLSERFSFECIRQGAWVGWDLDIMNIGTSISALVMEVNNTKSPVVNVTLKKNFS